jgi:hypothetical protein
MADQEWTFDFDRKNLSASSDLQLAVWNYLYVTRKFNADYAKPIAGELLKRGNAMKMDDQGMPWSLSPLDDATKKKLDDYLGIGTQSKARELGVITKTRRV